MYKVLLLSVFLSLPLFSDESKMQNVELIPLGTGKGATAVYSGEPSSSFVVRVSQKNILLVDVGIGTTAQCLKLCGDIPSNIFITHNHTDHSGELPVLSIVEYTKKKQKRIIAGPEVIERLKQYRFHELVSSGIDINNVVNWEIAPEGKKIKIDNSISLATYRAKHSEICYGFLLYFGDEAILGYSADSGYDEDFYKKLCQAPVVVLDARSKSSKEHASFDEVLDFKYRFPKTKIYITGYGKASEHPENLEYLIAGEKIKIR